MQKNAPILGVLEHTQGFLEVDAMDRFLHDAQQDPGAKRAIEATEPLLTLLFVHCTPVPFAPQFLQCRSTQVATIGRNQRGTQHSPKFYQAMWWCVSHNNPASLL